MTALWISDIILLSQADINKLPIEFLRHKLELAEYLLKLHCARDIDAEIAHYLAVCSFFYYQLEP
jgi:hypothetical protein